MRFYDLCSANIAFQAFLLSRMFWYRLEMPKCTYCAGERIHHPTTCTMHKNAHDTFQATKRGVKVITAAARMQCIFRVRVPTYVVTASAQAFMQATCFCETRLTNSRIEDRSRGPFDHIRAKFSTISGLIAHDCS